ncbi:MAG: hypothetical protein JWM95_1842 [Gemmatimonadetes bacterium]|nr:hypothetical protein [Gemmatimonadota bacterium]
MCSICGNRATSYGQASCHGKIRELLILFGVISPGSIRTDRVTKREYYMDAGVPDYLIVDVDARMIERWSRGRDTPEVLRDRLEWHPVGASAPLILSLTEFFDHILAQMQLIGNRGAQ